MGELSWHILMLFCCSCVCICHENNRKKKRFCRDSLAMNPSATNCTTYTKTVIRASSLKKIPFRSESRQSVQYKLYHLLCQSIWCDSIARTFLPHLACRLGVLGRCRDAITPYCPPNQAIEYSTSVIEFI